MTEAAETSSQPPTPSQIVRLDRACNAFEAAWREGSPPRIEDALAGWAEPDRSALLRELIHLEVYHRRARGGGCRPEDYLARFPTLDANWLAGAVADAVADAARTAPPDEGRVAVGPTPVPRVPGYEILGEVGRGGMGVVYRARETALDRDVAVKALKDCFAPGSDAARRFLAEVRVTAQLQHPAIPPVHQVGTLPDGRPFLVMKLIKGRTLDELLKGCPVPAAELTRRLAEFEQVCQAVGYAHARGVIHRDLKPSNVMVGAFGEVQVMDWGLAKVLPEGPRAPAARPEAAETVGGTVVSPPQPSDGSETQTGAMLGTPAFMPPEQAGGEHGKVDERADVFGLGAILAVLLTGQPPYAGGSAEAVRLMAVRGQLGACLARLDGCGAEAGLVDLCKRCLAFEPAGRPGDAGEVAAAVAGLRAAAEGRARAAEVAAAEAVGRAEEAALRVAEQQRKQRWQVATAGAAALVLLAAVAGLAAFLGVQSRKNEELRRARDEMERKNEELRKTRDEMERRNDELRKARDQILLTLTAQAAHQIGSDLKELEQVGRSLAALAQGPDVNEQQAEAWMRRILERDDRIFGLTLAFEPGHPFPHPAGAIAVASALGRLGYPHGIGPTLAALPISLAQAHEYCLYVSRKHDRIDKRYLHLEGYGYLRQAWYREPLKDRHTRWSPAPSEDEGGAGTPMVAFMVPMRQGEKRVGVVTVDLSLEGFFRKNSRFGDGLKPLQAGHRGDSYGFVIGHTRTAWDTNTARKYWDSGPGTGVFVHHPRFAFPARIEHHPEAPERYHRLARHVLRRGPDGGLAEQAGKVTLDDRETGVPFTYLFARVPSIEWTLVVVIEGAAGT